VPLIAAHGRDVPDLGTGTSGPDGAPGTEQHQDRDALEGLLDPYRGAYPDVEVTVLDRSGHPLAVLLDEAGPAQLLVLGRRRDDRRGGFVFGSVAHGVLHYAEVPVAIVPPVP
jgi:nucleotide-binding universal stress UspA family protein